MSESEGQKEPNLLPSGQPPSPSDLEDESDQGETSSPSLVTITQQENLVCEAKKDPPATCTGGLSDGDMEHKGETDVVEKASEETVVDNSHPEDESSAISTADQPPSVLPRGKPHPSTEMAVEATDDKKELSRVNRSHIPAPTSPSQTDQPRSMSKRSSDSAIQVEQAAALSPVVPNINASPRHDVKEVPDMLSEEETKNTTEDEKKSEDKSDAAVMPPPERRVFMNGIFSPPAVPEASGSPPRQAIHAIHHMPQHLPMSYGYAIAPVPSPYATPIGGGRRKIKLRLEEDVRTDSRRGSFFSRSFRHRRNDSIQSVDSVADHGVDRGSITVSWFEGTTSAELQEHVRKSVIRKMGLHGDVELRDMRIIDETMDPPEGKDLRCCSSTRLVRVMNLTHFFVEIVLSPFIPNGSRFLLRFSTKEKEQDTTISFRPRQYLNKQIASTAPESPSAAPSPHPSSGNLLNLNEAQLQILGAKLKALQLDTPSLTKRTPAFRDVSVPTSHKGVAESAVDTESLEGDQDELWPSKRVSKIGEEGSMASIDFNEEEVRSMHPDDQIETRLRQLTELLVSDLRGRREKGSYRSRQEKKQVIFVLANYFVLFLSVIAIMAEIQSRAPRWLAWAERNLESVQTCAMDQESLFKCVSSGDFSGLIASFVLWFGRSAATRRFFLFGFETPKRLWTVVYESLVTAFCWAVSYLFIRRGMNPDTRPNFVAKYWKDAVYGSLAGFNASFLKAVLKNLVPQEAVEHALQDNQLRILSWLPKMH